MMLNQQVPRFVVESSYRSTHFATFRQVLARRGLAPPPRFDDNLAPIGVTDALGLVAVDPDSHGCLLTFGIADAWVPSRRESLTWHRIATHLAAAYRLRRARSASTTASADAVLDPSGRVQQADGAAKLERAREALARGARSMDRARARLRRDDPDQAVEIWRALVDGSWSLVDHFDSDGRRYLLARRNEPHTDPLETLSARERQVLAFAAMGHTNKLIAYELGLSTSGVAMHLTRAARRLGARSRVELITAYRARRDAEGAP
jgi:DNA-binding CsgD family transcriptional regulator